MTNKQLIVRLEKILSSYHDLQCRPNIGMIVRQINLLIKELKK